MKYFTLNEFIKSNKAEEHNIDNTPSEDVIKNLNILVDNILDPLREAWGSKIRINSGFRCKKLNDIVGGVKNSSHLLGNAADIYPVNGKFDEFVKFITEWAENKLFDQIIIEKNRKSRWIHCSFKSNNGSQRRQLFKMNCSK